MAVASLSATEIERFEAWLEGIAGRQAELTTRELGRGIRAVSRVYVEKRDAGALRGRATNSDARRAAFTRFYAPLHFLCLWHAYETIRDALDAPPTTRILDLGCGSGAAGAAWALQLSPRPRIEGIDALGWALREARRTYRHFGLRARTRRGELPQALPEVGGGDLLICGWMLNELDTDARDALILRLERAIDRGAACVILEPLAGSASPWWDATAARLSSRGMRDGIFKTEVELPEPLRVLDLAAGLDHRVIGARWMAAKDRR
ncbi:MAG: methyltransferase domain-containing protein [Deltaproteobacteria bacterium]|nr:methyltransferase domain-containing protein [Deltaproteobacteria bacterium]MBW2394179.1 methyltransferase domain-containing protein [Deltaproteobacteria bacterium]